MEEMSYYEMREKDMAKLPDDECELSDMLNDYLYGLSLILSKISGENIDIHEEIICRRNKLNS